jgi:hypothetical protein
MKRITLFFAFVLCLSFGFSQETLKDKYLGIYEGKINGYKMDTGGELLDVAETTIKIELEAGYLNLYIGRTVFKGYYTVLFEAQDYYVLDAIMDNQSIGERIVVYKKGKKISRDGLYPQPSALLFKS